MLRKLLILIIALPLVGAVLLAATGHSYIFTALQRTYLQGNSTANINDHSAFDTRMIRSGEHQPWPSNRQLAPLPPALLDYEASLGGAAFLVVRNGIVLAEHYGEGYDARSRTNSFSVAKTVVTLLLGIAIDEGIVNGLDQPLTDWLPELNDSPLAKRATIGSLSRMTSGYAWDEHYYSPFSPTVELLYGDDVESFLLEGEFTSEPETFFYYSSASTQLLGLVLSRALRRHDRAMTLSEYLSQKIWRPLGMNDDAVWHLDGEGMELAYCCINTNARNFAKLGQLMLQKGRWGQQQIVSASFIDLMQGPTAVPYYGLSTWLNLDAEPAFAAMRGHLGQYVIMVPSENMIVVRLGESRDDTRDTLSDTLAQYVRYAMEVASAQEVAN